MEQLRIIGAAMETVGELKTADASAYYFFKT